MRETISWIVYYLLHFLRRNMLCFSILDVRGIVSECGQCPSQQSKSASDERKSRMDAQNFSRRGRAVVSTHCYSFLCCRIVE